VSQCHGREAEDPERDELVTGLVVPERSVRPGDRRGWVAGGVVQDLVPAEIGSSRLLDRVSRL
jgi:hypothetical protein